MLHHLTIGVEELARSAAFYDAVLSPLGYGRIWTEDTGIGYGRPGGGEKFAIELRPGAGAAGGPGLHVAFSAPSREALARFHSAALAHGGRDNDSPGMYHEHDEHYYPAYAFDPDGNSVEAVFTDDV
jgi:catechol 2,3-dioxygenase-like lactoylglutathione lyase family enzyme